MKKVIFTLAFILVSISGFAQKTDMELITETLTDYIEGTSNGEIERLKKAFHPDLNLYSVKEDKVQIWKGSTYISRFKKGEKNDRIGKVVSIDYENDAAIAKVEISFSKREGKPYVDYFMLLKTEGKWTIIHKMFTKRK